MANGSRTTYRYRLSVPDRDTAVREWIAAQDHLSMSLRLLIKEDIQRNGLADVTCRMIENGVSGGGRKQAGRTRPEAYEHAPRTARRQAKPVRDEDPGVDGDEDELDVEPEAGAGAVRAGHGEAPVPKAEPVRKTGKSKATGEEAGEEPAEAQAPAARPAARKPAAERDSVPGPAGVPADPMAFLSQTAGNAGGMMGMLGLDDDESESDSES